MRVGKKKGVPKYWQGSLEIGNNVKRLTNSQAPIKTTLTSCKRGKIGEKRIRR